jgi:hypothetical protein
VADFGVCDGAAGLLTSARKGKKGQMRLDTFYSAGVVPSGQTCVGLDICLFSHCWVRKFYIQRFLYR